MQCVRAFGHAKIARLVLAEIPCVVRKVAGIVDRQTAIACKRHLCETHEETAIRQIVAGSNRTGLNFRANQISVATLRFQIDRRWRACKPAPMVCAEGDRL